ncbi:MAG: SWIB/MDM2 domain-containing protein [Acetobacteraceae bacterium]|nr:SWIB/MDM2 domain-containing protein [Acetobacteraceae bacterium]
MATAKKSAGGAKKAAARKSAPAKKSAAKSAGKGAGKASGKTATRGGTGKTIPPAARRSGGSGAKSAGRGTGRGGASGGGRAPNPAFMKPMRPSEELAAVVGAEPQPRSEITKRVWDYIKRNNLQDQENKRQINADDNLRPVFNGQRSVSMFEMTKLVNSHLSEA